MNSKLVLIFIVFLLTLVLMSCGEKYDTNPLYANNTNKVNIGGDTVYVEIKPVWGGFNHPQAIIVGKEPFIYVADTDNNRVVMLNLNGDVLGTRSVKHPVALAQDYKFNLIVCARFDTLVNGQMETFSAVYKYDMVAAMHHIEQAPVVKLLPRAADLKFPDRVYSGVTTFYNNSFYVSRTGPDNSSFVDPDNSILEFDPKELYGKGQGDTLIGRVPDIDPLSSGLVSANDISALASVGGNNRDFIETLTGNNNLSVQWLVYVVTPISARYESKYTPADNVALMIPNRFSKPVGVTVDKTGNIYVADATKDSVYKFNNFGDELQSFGGSEFFEEPYDVAQFDKTLYVIDRAKGQVLRFVLSTDL